MTGTGLKIFESPEFGQTRIHIDEAGEPWWVCKDVAQSLGYKSTNMPDTFSQVPGIWKGRVPISTPGGTQDMLCVSEQGLYFFLGRSDKPKALPYQMKVAGEIMPSIRRAGRYDPTDMELDRRINDLSAAILTPDLVIRLATELKTARAEVAERDARIARDLPHTEAGKAFMDAGGCINFGEMAVILCGHGLDIGRTRLMRDCRDCGLLLVEPGRLNLPSQKAAERGLLIESQRVCDDGRTRGYSLITKKGQMHLLSKYFPDGFPRPCRGLLALN